MSWSCNRVNTAVLPHCYGGMYVFCLVYHNMNYWRAMPIQFLLQCIIVQYTCEIRIYDKCNHIYNMFLTQVLSSGSKIRLGDALSPAERIQQRFSCSALELVHCTAPFVASTVWMHSLLVAPGQRARCGAVGTQAGKQQAPPAPLAQPLMVIVADRSDTARVRKGCGKAGDGGKRWTDKAETATARCIFDIKNSFFLKITEVSVYQNTGWEMSN